MLIHHPYDSLGGANHGWLNAKHHFSFAGYHDAEKMSHGELLVINDDLIAPQTGFDPHPHRDMEIITYVRRGAISHQDDQGNQGCTSAGNVQVMSAGSGIVHSEYNLENDETSLYQIWITPQQRGIAPVWDMAEFPPAPVDGRLTLLVSGDGSAPLQINQDARIYAGRMTAGHTLTHQIKGKAYVLVSAGMVHVNAITATKGDGIAISDEADITLRAAPQAELLIIEVPGEKAAR